MRRNLILIIAMATAFVMSVSGCEDKPQKAEKAKPAQKVKVAPAKKTEPVPEEVAEPAAPPYVYSPQGRRDPFESFLASDKISLAATQPVTPLQKYDVSQLKLIGVIVGKGEPRAMVVAPDKKSYILKKGIKIGKNEGTVISIDSETVRVEERYYDFTGKVETAIREIQLPKREGVQ